MITVNSADVFPSENAVYIGLSDGEKYRILLKDYENLPFNCKPDDCIDGKCIDGLIYFSKKYNIYKSAIAKLALTDIPKKQLFQKLYFAVRQKYKDDKTEPETLRDLCGLVCDEFEESGYIDDRRYASNKAKYLKEYKKYGAGRIKEYLYQKGIPADIINETLDDGFFSDDEGDLENMRALLKKKYGVNLERLDKSDCKAVQKAIHLLVRAGYKYQQAKNAVAAFLDEANTDYTDYTEGGDYEDEF